MSSGFGESVEGYGIPVLNEREIRASAGLLFLAAFSSWTQILFKDNYAPIKYLITIFLADFIVRLFVSPRYSPALILGRAIVRGQTPEYVGAPQKKFAWTIGLFLSVTMFVFMVVLNSDSVISSLSCWICMIFLFFESAFGICLGCRVYGRVYKKKALYCPGEVCSTKTRAEIQRISSLQIAVLLGFVALIALVAIFFGASFRERPEELGALMRAWFAE